MLAKLITFDRYGVSFHPNHIAVHRGVLSYVRQCRAHGNSGVEAYELESTNVVRKYLGVVDLPVSLVLAKWTGALICININPLLSYRAMQAHHSQFVWYRQLFVLFSRFTTINTLRPIT